MKYYTMQEAMEKLHLSYRGLYGIIHFKKKINAIKSSSGMLLIPEEEIEKFLREHKVVQYGNQVHYIRLPEENKK